MKYISWKQKDAASELEGLYHRSLCPENIASSVAEIVKNVRENGDRAVQEYLAKFDHVECTPDHFIVSPEEYAEAEQAVDERTKEAVRTAIEHITSFAEACRPKDHFYTARPGVMLGEKFTPMERVGCYVPGGTAPLVSTVIHTVAIAKAAGVKEIIAATPPMRNGKVNPATLYAMKTAGATEVLRMGGAYAVAAMAYGTDTVKRVEKIVGPGNAFVAAAKKLVYGEVSIDMVAGPSEIMVIADDSADPAFAAADMLSQSEHGSGLEQAVIVSDSAELLKKVEQEYLRQMASLKRIDTIRRVLDKGVFFIEAKDLHQAAEIAGNYAPEHLEIMTKDPRVLLPEIKAAGGIFLGKWTPEPAGDFTAGPSHVLPTAGTAKFFHGITVQDFLRRSSVLEYTQEAILRELPAIECFAELEGLDGHGRSASIRRTGKAE